MWMFLPGKNRWIEYGFTEFYYRRNEDGSRTLMGTFGSAIDKKTLTQLLDTNNELVSYWLQPLGEKNRKAHVFPLNQVAPSPDQLAWMVNISAYYYNHNQNGEITHKLCSALGVTEYGLTEQGKEKIKEGFLDLTEIYFLPEQIVAAITEQKEKSIILYHQK